MFVFNWILASVKSIKLIQTDTLVAVSFTDVYNSVYILH